MSPSKSCSAIALALGLAAGCQEDGECLPAPPPVQESRSIRGPDGAAVHVHDLFADVVLTATATNRASEPCGFAIYVGFESPARDRMPFLTGTAPPPHVIEQGYLVFETNLPARANDRVFEVTPSLGFRVDDNDTPWVTFVTCNAPDLELELEAEVINDCENVAKFPGELDVLWP